LRAEGTGLGHGGLLSGEDAGSAAA
jgi:hypothetical protein